MTYIADVVRFMANARDFFYEIYIEVFYWIPPFNAAAPIFYSISSVFADLTWAFNRFDIWLDGIAYQINTFLDWGQIQSTIRGWLTGIEDLVAWFSSWWGNVINAVEAWWLSTADTVQGWINVAQQFLQSQVDNLANWLAGLEAAWNEWKVKIPSFDEVWTWFGNWWANVLAGIQNWWNETLPSVSDLMNSTLRDWFPFYDELAGLWNDIALFFTDPLQWLYERAEDFVERFW